MTAPRYNGFQLIHKALRLMLYETATSIQRNDFANEAQTQPLLQQLKEVLTFYDDHAFHENTIILPAMAKYNQGLVDEFEKEHEEDHQLVEELQKNISAWELANTDVERINAGLSIFYAMNEFIAFNLYHMNKEEKVLNPEFWKYYSDEEIMSWTQSIIRTIPPDKLTAQNRWMFRAVSAKEALIILQGISKIAPPEVAGQYLTLAREELSPERFEFVKANLQATA